MRLLKLILFAAATCVLGHVYVELFRVTYRMRKEFFDFCTDIGDTETPEIVGEGRYWNSSKVVVPHLQKRFDETRRGEYTKFLEFYNNGRKYAVLIVLGWLAFGFCLANLVDGIKRLV